MDETNLSTAQPSEMPPGGEAGPAQRPDGAPLEAVGSQGEAIRSREEAELSPREVDSQSDLMADADAEALSLMETESSSLPVAGAVAESAVAESPVSESPVAESPVDESLAVSTSQASPETAAAAAERPAEGSAKPAEEPAKPVEELPKSDKMDWYILKVQSNREESIREGLRKKIKIAGLERYFGEIIIPTEKVTEFKGGKRKVFKRKLYPGYLVVQMEINEDTWFLVRETTGIGDFTGAGGHPTPMQPREVAAILAKQEEKTDEAPKLKIAFRVGDHVKIKEGTFENFEGEVANIDETNGRVTVLINIFGRSTPVDIEYWQIETT